MRTISSGQNRRGYDLDPQLKMHIMTPRSKADETTPCLFYIHGGGFIFKADITQESLRQRIRFLSESFSINL